MAAASSRKEVFNYNRKFKEQLLLIKSKLENLQNDYGCSPNFLLMIEDNVTEKVNLRGRDSLTAGRTICCAEGELKEQFALGNINFHPDRMSFIMKGSKMQDDTEFLHDWAESVSRGIKRKHEKDEDEETKAYSNLMNDSKIALLEPKCELLEPKTEVSETIVKQEPVEEDANSTTTQLKEEQIKTSNSNSNLTKVEMMNTLGASFTSVTKSEKVRISIGNLMAKSTAQLLPSASGNKFTKIDPQLVINAADARKRDYSLQELLAQAAGGGMFSCGVCEFKTYCSKRLAVHVRSIHGYGAKKLVCRECGFSTTVKQDMGQHMREHKRELIKCNVDWCNFFTFDPKQSLLHAEQHRKQETNSPGGLAMKNDGSMTLGFQCPNCPFKSNSKKGIKVHENRIHKKEKEVFGVDKQTDSEVFGSSSETVIKREESSSASQLWYQV